MQSKPYYSWLQTIEKFAHENRAARGSALYDELRFLPSDVTMLGLDLISPESNRVDIKRREKMIREGFANFALKKTTLAQPKPAAKAKPEKRPSKDTATLDPGSSITEDAGDVQDRKPPLFGITAAEHAVPVPVLPISGGGTALRPALRRP